MERDVLDQKVNVQCHEFFLAINYDDDDDIDNDYGDDYDNNDDDDDVDLFSKTFFLYDYYS